MTRTLFLSALALAILSSLALFQIKYTVRDLEKQHRHVLQQIEQEENLIRTRKADLALLTRPQRLAKHARALGMKHAQGSRIVDAAQIGRRVAVDIGSEIREITLPSGGEGSLQKKPVATFRLKSLEDVRP